MRTPLFVLLGYIITLVSWGWMIVIAFKESVKTGFLFTLIPPYAVYYIITRWSKVKEPLVFHFVGWIILFIGI